MGNLYAIGDIHGTANALEELLTLVNPGPADTVVTLGDYVDRGPDTPAVFETCLLYTSDAADE